MSRGGRLVTSAATLAFGVERGHEARGGRLPREAGGERAVQLRWWSAPPGRTGQAVAERRVDVLPRTLVLVAEPTLDAIAYPLLELAVSPCATRPDAMLQRAVVPDDVAPDHRQHALRGREIEDGHGEHVL